MQNKQPIKKAKTTNHLNPPGEQVVGCGLWAVSNAAGRARSKSRCHAIQRSLSLLYIDS